MREPDQVREHYANLSEGALINIALYEVAGLTPNGVQMLRAELEARDLDGEFGVAVDAQLVANTPEKHAQIVERIRGLPCPLCDNHSSPLNGFYVSRVTSALVFTKYDRVLIIACPDCVSTAAANATRRTLWLGWWGIPWGPIRTIQAIVGNARPKGADTIAEPTLELRGYVEAQPGEAAVLVASRSLWNEIRESQEAI